mgnify:CR=1 FL=1
MVAQLTTDVLGVLSVKETTYTHLIYVYIYIEVSPPTRVPEYEKTTMAKIAIVAFLLNMFNYSF